MERMGALDSMFIAVEDAVSHMHIGSIGIFEGPTPSYERLRDLVASKLQLVPRYRQRVREAPASIGRPLWIDDVHFDLDYHLRHVALPTGRRSALEELVANVMSQPLDRHRSPWEMWLIEGLGDDRWAMLSKVHHCMVDGIAGSDLLAAVMDLERDAPVPVPDAWSPAPEPSRLELARYTTDMAIESVLHAVRGGIDVLRHPLDALGHATDLVAGAARMILPLRARGSPLTGPIGPSRRWARTRVSLDEIKAIRQTFGGTANDVILTVVTRGFREFLRGRAEPLDTRTITTLIPVSTRGEDGRGRLDNRVSAVYARLPIGIDNPVETLAAVRQQMDMLKVSHEIEASTAIVGTGDFAPPALAAVLARALVHSQRIVETVATNVPGPQVPLYVCRCRMLEAYPYVPIAGHIRVGVAIWSYCGEMHIGVTGDWDSMPDIDRLTTAFDVALEDLLKEAATVGG